ncbi:hypothetical protein BDQ12DRAFT_668293 [Crucibulum laeve]|uniref:Uncharacterized protein n=1 Tax=Crucibulum laeve TaxID=68775 RepID=A0A5C3LTE2_9AGAR|nr:hypothetical protein BDQ12DRAFT_668293 [Crucibulum laeve]
MEMGRENQGNLGHLIIEPPAGRNAKLSRFSADGWMDGWHDAGFWWMRTAPSVGRHTITGRRNDQKGHLHHRHNSSASSASPMLPKVEVSYHEHGSMQWREGEERAGRDALNAQFLNVKISGTNVHS